jgi:hemerythrin-like domain-containing protein
MASEARRVHSQHTQLTALLADLLASFDSSTDQMIRSAFEHFADATHAHMRVEETMYFPALHGLLPELDGELTALTEEHRELRRSIDDIREKLIAHDAARARSDLAQLASRSKRHEEIEEELMRRVRTKTGQDGGGG